MSKKPETTIFKGIPIHEGYFIDQHSGFKTRYKDLVVDGNGIITTESRADYDEEYFLPLPEERPLPFSRPEPEDVYIAVGTVDYTPVSPSLDSRIWNTTAEVWDTSPYDWEDQIV